MKMIFILKKNNVFQKYDNKIVKVVGLNVISDLVKIDYDTNISFVPLKDIKRLPNKDKEEYNEQRGR